MYGGLGSDVYLWRSGDGNDAIIETTSTSDSNSLRLDGVSMDDVYLQGSGNNLYVKIYENGVFQGQVYVQNQWYGDETVSGYEITTVEADDGSVDVTGGVLYRGHDDGEYLYARTDIATNDTLDGGLGNDNLYGYGGDDTFIYRSGDGNDAIYDYDGSNTVELLGMSSADVTYTDNGNDRTINITATGQSVFIDEYFANSWSIDFV